MVDDLEVLERDLGDLLRRTFAVVSDHATSSDFAAPVTSIHRSRPSRRRTWAAAVAAAVAALTAIAWNQLEPGEIERIPVEDALLHGEAAEGGQWWLIPSQALHEPFADVPSACFASVEMVGSDANRPGIEWNTGGVAYGEPTGTNRPGCMDESAWLADPTKLDMGSTRLGDGDDANTAWAFFATVHPMVVRAEVHADGVLAEVVATEPLRDRPDGPRFTAFTVPADTSEVQVDFLADDASVVASVTRTLPGAGNSG